MSNYFSVPHNLRKFTCHYVLVCVCLEGGKEIENGENALAKFEDIMVLFSSARNDSSWHVSTDAHVCPGRHLESPCIVRRTGFISSCPQPPFVSRLSCGEGLRPQLGAGDFKQACHRLNIHLTDEEVAVLMQRQEAPGCPPVRVWVLPVSQCVV